MAPAAAVDSRPVVSAATPPPPITGGTLLVTQDGTRAVAADPDRDRVSIVSMQDARVVGTIALSPGDEPGRVVEDAAHRVHVALRRGGAVATIDLTTNTLTARRAVCGAPRGIAYDAARDQIHVACAGGDLVSLPAAGGDAVRRVNLDVDLRDVIVRPDGRLFVSRFKSGDLLAVDSTGSVASRTKLRAVERASDSDSFGATSNGPDPLEPAVAWRTVGSPTTGGIFMLHQYGLASAIKIQPPTEQPVNPNAQPVGPPNSGSESYGTPPSSTCGGLINASVTTISADGTIVTMGHPLMAPVLTVDSAISPLGDWVLLAHAGLTDPNAPANFDGFQFQGVGRAGAGAVSLIRTDSVGALGGGALSCSQLSPLPMSGQVTAVAFNPVLSAPLPNSTAWFVVQTREPARLILSVDAGAASVRTVELGGPSVLDTGHELFHRDAGGGIACASCHAEGGEDGRVWRFDPIGERRTQALHVGLKGTEPFHWDGDMTNFGMLVEEVMVRRMGGPEENDPRKDALKNWLFSLKPPASIVAPDDPAAVHGKALFESAAVGCSGCHTGATLTSNQNVYVGTTDPGHLLQVPSLHGVGFRGPFIHNGCAVTLRDRFDPGCGGGDEHGRTSGLADADLSDLIAYLDSL
jgi:DNA-binding beta-propeller fold protein YncE